MDKEILYNSIDNGAFFVGEEPLAKDAWVLKYEYNGVRFEVYAYGEDRWLDDDKTNISIISNQDMTW